MIKILISACLLGHPVRYDGKGKRVTHPLIAHWQDEGRLIPICPEIAGGLSTPRPPAEIQQGNGHDVLAGDASIIDITGQDQTQPFIQGAQQTLALAREHAATIAILTDKSPSCGSSQIYNGLFNGTLKAGMGTTAALLKAHGIEVFSAEQIEAAARHLKQLEQSAELQ